MTAQLSGQILSTVKGAFIMLAIHFDEGKTESNARFFPLQISLPQLAAGGAGAPEHRALLCSLLEDAAVGFNYVAVICQAC